MLLHVYCEVDSEPDTRQLTLEMLSLAGEERLRRKSIKRSSFPMLVPLTYIRINAEKVRIKADIQQHVSSMRQVQLLTKTIILFPSLELDGADDSARLFLPGRWYGELVYP